MQLVRVAIVDDHQVVIEGLSHFFRTCPDIVVAGTASTTGSGLALVRNARPDVAIVDLSLPCAHDTATLECHSNGINLITELHRLFPELAILAWAARPAPILREYATRVGAAGFLAKTASGAEIIDTVRTLQQGKTTDAPFTPIETLTRRELQVLYFLAQGHTYSQIADLLALSCSTVKGYVKDIYVKLAVSSRHDAASLACQLLSQDEPERIKVARCHDFSAH